MENATKREKFLYWLIRNSNKGWLWLLVIIASSILVNGLGGFLAGLGVVLFGALAYAAGINFALEVTLGADYAEKGLWKIKDKAKEKKNDTAN